MSDDASGGPVSPERLNILVPNDDGDDVALMRRELRRTRPQARRGGVTAL